MSDHWSEIRIELLALLERKDPDAGDLYRRAIESLERPLTRASVMIVSHCIRELVKVLPVILGYPIVERADASRTARELHRQWTASDLSLESDGVSEAEVVSIPASVFNAARNAANAGAEGRKNSRELTAIIVTGQTGDADTASVKRVHKSIELFRGLAHARDYTQPVRSVPSRVRVLEELDVIEQALMNRLGNMADRAKSVRHLLADANRKLEDVQP